MNGKGRVIVIDDEVNAASALETLLREDGFEVASANDARTGLTLLEKHDPDIVLTDLRMPGMDGLELLARIKQARPETMVVIMTAYGTVKTAVKAMKLGAEDYLSKPIDVEELEVVLQKTLEKKRLVEEARVLRERVDQKYRFENLIGESPGMLSCFKTVRQVAPSSASVLLLGESGTGKELFAQALHQGSPRRNRPFIKVACSALPETLLESELFGHEKGSFTGALYSRAGRFEMADGGTLFLDEIGDISPTVQVKLLRFLEEREFERVGGSKTFKVDVRIVAATHRDLRKKIEDGQFREDLYYRLNVIELHIPSLRERPSDIPLLAHHFLHRFAVQNRKEVRRFSDDAMALLLGYRWPGNVRELENAIERAVVLSEVDVLDPGHFPTLRRVTPVAATAAVMTPGQPPVHEPVGLASAPYIAPPPEPPTTSAAEATPAANPVPAPQSSSGLAVPAPVVPIPGSTLADIEREAILRTLDAVNGSTSKAARVLKISPRKIQYKLKEYQQQGLLPRR
ncbi:MAG: sigma-54 dependent transcriptional regulator [Vicinamibacteria bacterium]|nr:sigma-54 dependent transcriptional regulator [Vicinamibacteria bacterium]